MVNVADIIALSNAIEIFLDAYKAGIFLCDVCGKIVYPKVTINESGIFIERESAEFRGGLGNHIIKKNVCENCLNAINLMKNKEEIIRK